jgi:hypothetical protein
MKRTQYLFLPEGTCPKCNKGHLIDTDEKREVTREAKTFIDAPKRHT